MHSVVQRHLQHLDRESMKNRLLSRPTADFARLEDFMIEQRHGAIEH
jgi:hypothetical protein